MPTKKKKKDDRTTAMKRSLAREIDWATRQSKRRNDALLGHYMMPLLTGARNKLRVLSLPGKDWIFERGLADMAPTVEFEFCGLDRDRKIAQDQIDMGGRLCTVYSNACFIGDHSTVKKYLKDIAGSANTFDIIYFDYMGPWSNDRKAELHKLFEGRHLDVGGYLILTLSLCRTKPERYEEIREYAEGHNDILVLDDRRDQRQSSKKASKTVPGFAAGIACWIQQEAAHHGMTLQTFPPHIYYNLNGNGPKPELSLCFARSD